MQLTDEELALTLAKMEKAGTTPPSPAEEDEYTRLVAEKMARMEAAQRPAEPQQAALPKEDASVLQEALHVGKGVGRMALDVANTPFYLREMGRMGAGALGMQSEDERRAAFRRNATPEVRAQQEQMDRAFGAPEGDQPVLQQVMDGIGPDGTYAAFEDFVAGEVVDPDANPWVDRARTAVEWSNPFKAKSIATALRSNVDEVAAPIGAATGEAVVNEMNQDRAIGELTGGGLGTVAGIAANAIMGGRRAAREAPFRIMEEQGVDIPDAIKAAQEGLDANEAGTTADLARNDDLFDLESVVAGDNRIKSQIQDKQSARTAQIAEGIRNELGITEPSEALNTAAERTAQRQEAIDQSTRNVSDAAVDEAESAALRIEEGIAPQNQTIDEQIDLMRAADEAAERAAIESEGVQAGVTSDELPYQAGMRLRNTISAEEAAFAAGPEAEAWNAFLSGPNIDTSAIQRSINRAMQGLTTGQREMVTTTYKNLLRRGGNWKSNKTAKPIDVKEWLEDLREAAYTPDKDGRYTKEQFYLRKIINGTEDGLGDANQLLKQAKERTREKYTRFRPDKINAAMRAEPEQFGDRLNLAGSSGAAAERVVSGTGIDQAQQDMIAMLRAEAGNAGGVDEAFIKKYAPVISKLPEETAQEFTSAAMTKAQADELAKNATEQGRLSQATVKAAEQEIKVLNKAAEQARAAGEEVSQQAQARRNRLNKALQNNIVTRYNNNPQKVTRELMNNPDSASDLRRLNEYMKSQGAQDSFRGQLQRQLTDQVLTLNNADVAARPEKIKEFNTLVGNLKRGGVITADEADKYMADMRKSMTVEQRQKALKSALVEEEGEWQNLLASAISAAVLSGAGGSQSLLVGAAVRRWVFRRLDQRGVKAPEIEQLENLLLDPEEFISKAGEWEALRGMRDEQKIQDYIDRKMRTIIGTGQATAIQSGENDRER